MKYILNVYPGDSIGQIKLGMSRSEVYELLGDPIKQSETLEWVGDYHIEYKDNKVIFIEIPYAISEQYFVLFKNIDLFNTEASLLIEILSKYGKCTDNDFGYSYYFPTFVIAFWRPTVFEYSMITVEELIERGDENMIDDMRRLYFETVCVFEEGYYD